MTRVVRGSGLTGAGTVGATASPDPLTTCHDEGHQIVNWSVTSMGQYGVGCLDCKLFWTGVPTADSGWDSRPLDEVYFPVAYERIPRYRNIVGWKGQS